MSDLAPRPPRIVIVTLATFALLAAWCTIGVISKSDPWYRNADMNIHNMVDALSLNSDLPPNRLDQPGTPTKFLLALDYRVLHYANRLPVWNMKKFAASPDPLGQISPLIHIGRMQSRVLLLACLLCAGWLIYLVTREITAPGVAIILLCGCPGVLFHALLTRTELLCVFLGNVLALLCTWKAMETRHWVKSGLWLFLAGLLIGVSAIEKLPGVCYLAMCYGWCWLAAMSAPEPVSESRPVPGESSRYWWGLLPGGAGMAVLGLLFVLSPYHHIMGPVALARLRLAAVAIAVLPLLTLWPARSRFQEFCAARGRELALLGGGALASFPLCYLLLRTVLSGPGAGDYMVRVLQFMVDPAPEMRNLADSPHVAQELMRYFQQDAWLFLVTAAVAGCVFAVRSIPLRLKLFIGVLLGVPLVMIVLLSKRHFTIQYSVYYQVPFLMVWALGLHGLSGWLRGRFPSRRFRWGLPVVAGLAFVLVLTAYPRLQYKYSRYQNDATLPVSDLTLTFLFDHDAHTQAYLDAMKKHYGDRQQFAATLERYLADPANRY